MDSARPTIDTIPRQGSPCAWAAKIADYGCRRFLCYTLDFDSRALVLEQNIGETWDEAVKQQWRINKEQIKNGLLYDFGEKNHDAKVANFEAIKSAPFSIISYHNILFHQVRWAFVVGSFYPALVGACALGERLLNHLILDLRGYYRTTPEYRLVGNKDSILNWQIAISTLSAWGILLPKAAEEFQELGRLRHRSIHFNPDTYSNLRDDALKAVLHLRAIIEAQFSSFSDAPWFIRGTLGHVFVARSWERHPFVETFILPGCQLVGPLFAIKFLNNRQPLFCDRNDYGDEYWSDEEFRDRYNNRKPEDLVKPPEDIDQENER